MRNRFHNVEEQGQVATIRQLQILTESPCFGPEVPCTDDRLTVRLLIFLSNQVNISSAG